MLERVTLQFRLRQDNENDDNLVSNESNEAANDDGNNNVMNKDKSPNSYFFFPTIFHPFSHFIGKKC